MNTTDYTTVMALLEIPSEYVQIDHQMNPKTEDLISGRKLEEGMIVLLEESILREDPERLKRLEKRTGVDPEELAYEARYIRNRLNKSSRWFRILEIEPSTNHDDIVHFIALYSDGTKASHMFNKSYHWFVKTSV